MNSSLFRDVQYSIILNIPTILDSSIGYISLIVNSWVETLTFKLATTERSSLILCFSNFNTGNNHLESFSTKSQSLGVTPVMQRPWVQAGPENSHVS
jgi:hypothetical protein